MLLYKYTNLIMKSETTEILIDLNDYNKLLICK